jgi:hypothetical protein
MSNYGDDIVETTTYTTYGTPQKRTVVETTTYSPSHSPRHAVTRRTPHIETTTEEVYVSPNRGDASPRGRKTPQYSTVVTTSEDPVGTRLPELSSLYSPAKVTTEYVTVHSPSRRTVQYISSPTQEVVHHVTHVVPETTVQEIENEMDRTRARMEEMTDIFHLHNAIKPGEPLYGFPYSTSPTHAGPAHETVVVKQVSPSKTVTTTHISPAKQLHTSYTTTRSVSPLVTTTTTTTESPIRYVTQVSPVKTTTVSSPGWSYRTTHHDLLE